MEFVVDRRDENGRPSIIGFCPIIPPSDLKRRDDKKLSRKRRAERQTLISKNQQHLENLYNLPAELENVSQKRHDTGDALRDELEKLGKERDEKSAKKDDDSYRPSLIEKLLAYPGRITEITKEDEKRVKIKLLLPRALENLRKSGREPTEEAIDEELNKLVKEQEEEEKKKEVAQLSSAVEAQTSQPSPQLEYYVTTQSDSWAMVYLSFALSGVFFLMAVFPSFRSFVIREVIVNFVIGGVAPPLLRGACVFGETFTERWPLTSFLIVSLYNVFGFWVLAAGMTWAAWNLWTVVRVVDVSTRALANTLTGGTKKLAK